jgi:hypothetical protein
VRNAYGSEAILVKTSNFRTFSCPFDIKIGIVLRNKTQLQFSTNKPA